jgi:small subunit ribosomal protein S8
MNVTDPIADFLTRIRNAQLALHKSTEVPGSRMNLAVAKVLEASGYIAGVAWRDEGPQGWIDIDLKYTPGGEGVIQGIQRESTPGQRVYVKKDEIPEVLAGLGIAILSTSQGVMTGQDAAKSSAGGELLATVW